MIQACQGVEARGTGCQRFVQLGVLDSDAGLISQAPRQPTGILVKAMTALAKDMQHSSNSRCSPCLSSLHLSNALYERFDACIKVK
jgi:hypothetical protein